MENKKTPPSGDLVGELLEGILSDVEKLTASIPKLASKDDLSELAKAVASLEKQLASSPPTPVDLLHLTGDFF